MAADKSEVTSPRTAIYRQPQPYNWGDERARLEPRTAAWSERPRLSTAALTGSWRGVMFLLRVEIRRERHRQSGARARAPQLARNDVLHGSAFAHRLTAFMTNASGGDMAKQGTKDTTASKASDDSAIEQSARAVGQLVESGATVMGRGLAAGVEGMVELKERAAEMTGLTSASAAGKTAESAARTTITAARSVARSAARATRRAASSTASAASRTAGRAMSAAKRTAGKAKGKAKRTVRAAVKASTQKGRRKVSQLKSMRSKRTGAKSGRSRKR